MSNVICNTVTYVAATAKADPNRATKTKTKLLLTAFTLRICHLWFQSLTKTKTKLELSFVFSLISGCFHETELQFGFF
jgi:hypothetical protein